MRLDLVGSVEQLRLTPGNCFYPVFEAVSNSIHAIRDLGRSDGLIRIELIRDDQQGILDLPSGSEPSGRGSPEIAKIRITDNGEGFIEDNFVAFNELYTRRKSHLGAKGVGRLTWLKVFDHANVASVYRDGSGWRIRAFDFVLPNGVENARDDPLPDGGASAASTTVILVSPLTRPPT